jgi:hypothetical protein
MTTQMLKQSERGVEINALETLGKPVVQRPQHPRCIRGTSLPNKKFRKTDRRSQFPGER